MKQAFCLRRFKHSLCQCMRFSFKNLTTKLAAGYLSTFAVQLLTGGAMLAMALAESGIKRDHNLGAGTHFNKLPQIALRLCERWLTSIESKSRSRSTPVVLNERGLGGCANMPELSSGLLALHTHDCNCMWAFFFSGWTNVHYMPANTSHLIVQGGQTRASKSVCQCLKNE